MINVRTPGDQNHFSQENLLNSFEEYLSNYFLTYKNKLLSSLRSNRHQKSLELLLESIQYSLMSGGKRFRPLLCLNVGQALGAPPKKLLPFATAVEMVHTYSLIHDDLPAMDNDDFRRGQPTNHKKFGESVALLAGDSLLTECFLLLTEAYADQPPLAQSLTRNLAEKAGLQGMVAGQILDLKSTERLTESELQELHHLKTGALIQACAKGAYQVAYWNSPNREEFERGVSLGSLMTFAQELGLAFQVADDLLDADRTDEASKSFVGLLGIEKTKKLLNNLSESCHNNLKKTFVHLDSFSDGQKFYFKKLVELVQFNEERKK